MNSQIFIEQVELLLKIIPFINPYKQLAIKGGTAINLFIRNMPRLSVDIDLTYLPLEDRSTSLKAISEIFLTIKHNIESKHQDIKGHIKRTSDSQIKQIVFVDQKTQVKVEINHTLRGVLFQPMKLDLCDQAQKQFVTFVEANILSFENVYAGKICAALDRQHPRDLFDIKILLESEGISSCLREAFIVYLICNNRPIIELLNPNSIPFEELYKQELEGMTSIPTSYNELVLVRQNLINTIKKDLTNNERLFLCSIKEGEPKWSLLNFPDLSNLPAVQWKLTNIRKMEDGKRKFLLEKLKMYLEV